MFKKQIKIKYHSDEIQRLEKITKGDWIDLRSAEHKVLKAGEFALVNLGVSMQLPKGYEAHIVPRSSTFKTWGLLQTNPHSVIDNSYCANDDIWKYPVVATKDVEINVNDRICQFRIVKNQPTVEFIEVEDLNNEARGGIGSTGVS